MRNELENNILLIAPVIFNNGKSSSKSSSENYFLLNTKNEITHCVALHANNKQSDLDIITICENAVMIAIRSYCMNHDASSTINLVDNVVKNDSCNIDNFISCDATKDLLLSNHDSLVFKPLRFRQALNYNKSIVILLPK